MSYPTNQVSLVFSFLSTVATSLTMVSLAAWIPENKLNLRWKLILNLLLSELLNSANNSISGFFGMVGQLNNGSGCVANGFIGQWTIQAADLSTLAIAIVTFITLKSCFDPKALQRLESSAGLIFTIIWIYPLITSIVGYFWPGYVPTSSNWCWLATDTLARYVLTHGLRIIIFIVIIILYSQTAFQLISAASSSNGFNIKEETDDEEIELGNSKTKIYNATLRLMAFPIAYLILWSPGMANRCNYFNTNHNSA